MHARFLSSLATGVAGAFVVVASQAFVNGTAAWIAFGIGIAAIALAFVPVLFAGERSVRALGLDASTLVLGAWTVVASVVFTGNTLHWLTFGEGAALAALAVVGLTVNQLRLARAASHELEPARVEPSRRSHLAA